MAASSYDGGVLCRGAATDEARLINVIGQCAFLPETAHGGGQAAVCRGCAKQYLLRSTLDWAQLPWPWACLPVCLVQALPPRSSCLPSCCSPSRFAIANCGTSTVVVIGITIAMAGTLQLLQCVIPVDEAEDDPRIASDYAASSAALLELFSTEVLAVKRWPSWGIPEAHFPAFPAFLAVYGVWREATLVDGAFDRAVKEIICACVSLSVRPWLSALVYFFVLDCVSSMHSVRCWDDAKPLGYRSGTDPPLSA